MRQRASMTNETRSSHRLRVQLQAPPTGTRQLRLLQLLKLLRVKAAPLSYLRAAQAQLRRQLTIQALAHTPAQYQQPATATRERSSSTTQAQARRQYTQRTDQARQRRPQRMLPTLSLELFMSTVLSPR